MLRKKYIRFNISLYIVFVLIVKKLNEKLKLYIDYQALNVFIVFNRNASSLIKKTFIKLYAARIYNKFDIIIIFNEIRIKEKHKKKIIFFIKYDFYKYMIMLFNLYNAFITF